MSKTLLERIQRLEAENAELRRLWIENEGDIIELSVRVDKLIHDEQKKTKRLLARIILKLNRSKS